MRESDEIWHAGDIGNLEVLEQLEALKPVRAVWGNIDGNQVRAATPEKQLFKCEDVLVLIIHIGGYPERYAKGIPELLRQKRPGMFICGHSHILKVMFDKRFNLLHMNPGALGKQGIHRVQTMLLFQIEGEKISNLRIVELERKKT